MSAVQQVRSKWIPAIETVRSLFGAITFKVNVCRSHQKGKSTALHQGSCASLYNQENNTVLQKEGVCSVADPGGGAKGAMAPPWPCKNRS